MQETLLTTFQDKYQKNSCFTVCLQQKNDLYRFDKNPAFFAFCHKMSEEFVDQCCDKANDFIARGDFEKAKKFLQKAADRDPGNSKVIALLQILASHEQKRNSNEFAVYLNQTIQSQKFAKDIQLQKLNKSHAVITHLFAIDNSLSLQEQKEIADQINKKNNYYDILGVEKTASQADIKKAYRKVYLCNQI